MADKRICSFTGKTIPPGTGSIYVRKNGQVLHFINSKARKNMLKLKRNPSRTEWTDIAHKNKKAK